jgi:hypothetical protein
MRRRRNRCRRRALRGGAFERHTVVFKPDAARRLSPDRARAPALGGPLRHADDVDIAWSTSAVPWFARTGQTGVDGIT